MTRLIDLTRLMDPANKELLPDSLDSLRTVIAPDIEYYSPAGKGRDRMVEIFDIPAHELPDGEGWGEDMLQNMNTHCGTHVDAPIHSGRRIEGKPARTISDIDLHELYRPGMVLDLRADVTPNEGITIDVLKRAIKACGKDIEEGDAVLLRTGQERYEMSQPEYYTYPGMTGDGTRFLTGEGATILGTDAMAWDRPFPVMKAAYAETGDKHQVWDGHFAIRDREAFIVQQMTNLAALPPHGFTVGFFPLRLLGTSAAPARVVAFVTEQ